MDYDVAIIGSGFGAAPVALRAAEAGLRVVVLERGGALDDAALDEMRDGRRPLLRWNIGGRSLGVTDGAMEVVAMRGLGALTGIGVGGGSLHYTLATMRPDSNVFSETPYGRWPRSWSAAAMRCYFDRAAAQIAPIIAPTFAQTTALESCATAKGLPARRLDLAARIRNGDTQMPAADRAASNAMPTWRHDVADWMECGGTVRRRSLVESYLTDAMRLGAEIEPFCSASMIVPLSSTGAAGYRIVFQRGAQNNLRHSNGARRSRRASGMTQTISARRVVVSAGTLNTTRLLLQQRDVCRTLPRLSSTLGESFFTNGDYGGVLIGGDTGPGNDGAPPATAWIDAWRRDGLYLMDLGRVPVVERWLKRVMRGASGNAHGADVSRSWLIGVMGRDQNAGRLILSRSGAMQHQLPRGGRDHLKRAAKHLDEIGRSIHARVWRVPIGLARRMPFTVHPVGGCIAADRVADGVCDERGRVYGYRGLFVSDGSLLALPPGCPPSLTIAAAAERVAEAVVNG